MRQQLSHLHYVDFVVPASDKDLLPELMTAVHHFNALNDNALGLDLPDTAGTAGEKGCRVRVLGPVGELQNFCSGKKVRRLGLMLGASLAGGPVPQCSIYAQVRRFNAGDRNKESYRQRLQRRAEKRGEVLGPQHLQKKAPSVQNLLYVEMTSTSNGNRFLMKLQRSLVTQVAQEVEFNAYGLCKTGAVPAF